MKKTTEYNSTALTLAVILLNAAEIRLQNVLQNNTIL